MHDVDDIETMSSDLRAMRVEELAPRYRPLQLDRMFTRAQNWKTTSRPPPVIRAPSPPRPRTVFPLPNPMREGERVSPLGGLFDFPELLPQVLRHFDQPKELVVLARVNKAFCSLARKKLYDHVWVRPWEANCHDKLVLLFETLRQFPSLCNLVRTLDVRFFPLSTRDTERYDLDERIQEAVEHMNNLQHLIWTRDKSLNPPLVERISKLSRLTTLELSGHAQRYYDPQLLGTLPLLDELRLMMPDSTLAKALLNVIKMLDARPRGGLLALALVCRSSPLIDDALLKDMAPYLRSLRRLTLWGCTRATKAGVFELLREAEYLEELSLDALPHSGMIDLSQAPSLHCLTTLSLSFTTPHKTAQHPYLAVEDLPTLPTAPNLESLLLLLTGDRASVPHGGLAKIQSQVNVASLRRLSLLHLYIGLDTLTDILTSSPKLEELYLSINGRNTLIDCAVLQDCGLRILHVTAPERWGPSVEDMTVLARGMPRLEQVGSGNRVYEVVRRYDGEQYVVELVRWSRTAVPGYFQVWRG